MADLIPLNSGYVDLQVNGYGGIDFNDSDLTAENLHLACERLQKDGVDQILATIITEQIPIMCHRLKRLVEFRERDPLIQKMVPGIHIEGPFMSALPGFRGAHPVDALHPANADEAKQLFDACGGLLKLITLSPEQDPGMKTTCFFADQGVAVSGGHSDASVDQLKQAIDAGLTLWTHLGNGCPMQMNRHDNIVQRVLSLADKLHPCFIADGVHVPIFALGNYLKCAGLDRCIVVTDAISAAGLGPGRYRLGRWDLQIGEDLAARAPDGSHLVGSAITMRQSENNLRQQLGLSPQECHRLMVDNPKALLSSLVIS